MPNYSFFINNNVVCLFGFFPAILSLVLFYEPPNVSAEAEHIRFRVATYNVENLFDLDYTGTEYKEYVPDSNYGWNGKTAEVKFNNIAAVIKGLKADVVALQEVESHKALMLLRKSLFRVGVDYPFFDISDSGTQTVKCALLSKFKITDRDELRVHEGGGRTILKVRIDVFGTPFMLYVNHWRSKKGPESNRIKYANALKNDLINIAGGADYLLIGDFNSDYNEYETIINAPELNDTNGKTGLNHVLGTLASGAIPVDETMLLSGSGQPRHYNLWYELKPEERWSYIYSGRKGSLDHIIVPASLYDSKGIDYVDNSFNRYRDDTLIKGSRIYRWQRAKKGRGSHLGKGYSDHLPVFATFSIVAK